MLDSVVKLREMNTSIRWVDYLVNTNKKNVNYERINSIREIDNKNVYNYVLRTLEILDNEKDKYDDKVIYYVEEALKWAEVSKCGSSKVRQEWKKKKINLYVHNVGSSDIYKNYCYEYDEIVFILIKTHGLIGQAIRGENSFDKNYLLYKSSIFNISVKVQRKRCRIDKPNRRGPEAVCDTARGEI